jgi:hypothetical protein
MRAEEEPEEYRNGRITAGLAYSEGQLSGAAGMLNKDQIPSNS